MSCNPFQRRCIDHTSQKQPDTGHFMEADPHKDRRRTIYDTEWAVDHTSVDKFFLFYRRGNRFQNPSQKGIGQKQPEQLISCVLHRIPPIFKISPCFPSLFQITGFLQGFQFYYTCFVFYAQSQYCSMGAAKESIRS